LIVAVNQERKGVIVGSALLQREDTESFEWAFGQLKAMAQVQPRILITDGMF